MSTIRPERRARQLSGLPRVVDHSQPLAKRLLKSPWTWILLLLFVAYAYALVDMYLLLHEDQQQGDITIPGVTMRMVKRAAGYAWPTALVWSLIFMALDRFRPQRLLWWVVAFGWGACISTWASLYINTWAGELLMVTGGGDPGAGSRPAVFVAPFVEEAAKATILFALAVLVRYRIVSILQSVALAGLSAIGFAFTENIVYYLRAITYSSVVIQTGDAEAAIQSLVRTRGLYTSFGHPLFTTMTGVGLAVGLRSRSKLVRIIAPVTGFCLAALGHMAFNGTASVVGDRRQLMIMYFIALGLVLSVAGFLLGNVFKEGVRIRARLTDFVRMGWLSPRDPIVFSSVRRRFWIALVALTRGPGTFLATQRMLRSMTELAYLRDSMTRGLIDASGTERAKELILQLDGLRPLAISDTVGARIELPRFWRRPALSPAPVDARWGPPTA